MRRGAGLGAVTQRRSASASRAGNAWAWRTTTSRAGASTGSVKAAFVTVSAVASRPSKISRSNAAADGSLNKTRLTMPSASSISCASGPCTSTVGGKARRSAAVRKGAQSTRSEALEREGHDRARDFHGRRTERHLLEGDRTAHGAGDTEIRPVLVSAPIEEKLLFLHVTVAEVQGHDEPILTNVGGRIERDRLH